MIDAIADQARAAIEPQPDLLGLPETVRVAELRERRRAGRPPGARNRRAEDVARWVVEHIGDPLVMLATLAATPAEELAASAGCTVMEALVEKRLAALAVLPYVHRRQPLGVDVTNRSVVHLTIVDGHAPAETIELDQWVDDGAADAV